uniref:Uncharacterized protein n=1 Tax=Cynoglossus semilaevis TaxID=244447 RepID=A0A3P8UVQ8_CYNSE
MFPAIKAQHEGVDVCINNAGLPTAYTPLRGRNVTLLVTGCTVGPQEALRESNSGIKAACMTPGDTGDTASLPSIIIIEKVFRSRGRSIATWYSSCTGGGSGCVERRFLQINVDVFLHPSLKPSVFSGEDMYILIHKGVSFVLQMKMKS